MTKLLTILTLRCNSSRLPGKALAPITSRVPGSSKKVTLPLSVWILRRLRQMDTMLCVATTESDTDNELARVMKAEGVEVVRGSTDDVIGRMDAVIQTGQYPGVTHILRMLGDMPWPATELIEYSTKRLSETGKDAFVWALDSEVWPLYGCREFAYSLKAWRHIVRNSTFREHPDEYFHKNRKSFDILFHLPPENFYFRQSYRTEVDHERDLDLVRAVADEVGMLSPVKEIVHFLDIHPEIAKINSGYSEKTGPLSLHTYSNSQRRAWLMGLANRNIMTWQGEWIKPPGEGAFPIFCRCGNLLGHGWESKLYTRNRAVILKQGFVRCPNCMMVKEWRQEIPRQSRV